MALDLLGGKARLRAALAWRWTAGRIILPAMALLPALALHAPPALPQTWAPQRSVELIVPASAGGSLDITGRTVQKLWQDLKLVAVPTFVTNRPGAGHLIGYNAVNQRGGDPHCLGIATSVIITGYIEGRLPVTYSGFTPLSLLLTEYIGFAVRAGSPLATGRDLLDALRRNPAGFTIALGSAVGGTHHIAAGLPLQAAGIDVGKITFVGYNSSAEAITALIGGHVDVAAAGTVNITPHLESGRLRALAVSAPKRMGGALANIPTWPELGLTRGVSGSWRALIGGKGMPFEAVAYWSAVMQKVVRSDEFVRLAEKNQWEADFKGPADTRKFMEEQHAELQSVMAYLGLAGDRNNSRPTTGERK